MCKGGEFVGGVRIENGDVCYSGTTLGAGFVAQPFCDEGYQLQSGSSGRRECQNGGMWSGSPAQCVLEGIIY